MRSHVSQLTRKHRNRRQPAGASCAPGARLTPYNQALLEPMRLLVRPEPTNFAANSFAVGLNLDETIRIGFTWTHCNDSFVIYFTFRRYFVQATLSYPPLVSYIDQYTMCQQIAYVGRVFESMLEIVLIRVCFFQGGNSLDTLRSVSFHHF